MTYRIAAILLCSLFVTACAFPNLISPYKLDIPQGNAITADQVAQLKVGMSPSQVRYILGTPLLSDPFHAQRWDYIFTDARNGELRTRKIYTVTFENDKLASFSGETLPAKEKTK